MFYDGTAFRAAEGGNSPMLLLLVLGVAWLVVNMVLWAEVGKEDGIWVLPWALAALIGPPALLVHSVLTTL